MTSLNQDFDFFAANGVPLRAKCAVTIKEQKPEFDANLSGPGRQHRRRRDAAGAARRRAAGLAPRPAAGARPHGRHGARRRERGGLRGPHGPRPRGPGRTWSRPASLDPLRLEAGAAARLLGLAVGRRRPRRRASAPPHRRRRLGRRRPSAGDGDAAPAAACVGHRPHGAPVGSAGPSTGEQPRPAPAPAASRGRGRVRRRRRRPRHRPPRLPAAVRRLPPAPRRSAGGRVAAARPAGARLRVRRPAARAASRSRAAATVAPRAASGDRRRRSAAADGVPVTDDPTVPGCARPGGRVGADRRSLTPARMPCPCGCGRDR